MTPDPTTTHDHADDTRDRLVTRLIDGMASPDDWQHLRHLASSDPDRHARLLDEIERTQQIDAALSETVARQLDAACSVAPPSPERPQATLRLVRAWSGWAVAAALALMWSVLSPGAGMGSLGDVQRAGVPVIPASGVAPDEEASVDQAFDQYVRLGTESGRVLEVDPELRVVESTPLADGSGVEVVYVRRVLERVIVDEVYRKTTDELGRVVPVRLERLPRRSGPM